MQTELARPFRRDVTIIRKGVDGFPASGKVEARIQAPHEPYMMNSAISQIAKPDPVLVHGLIWKMR